MVLPILAVQSTLQLFRFHAFLLSFFDFPTFYITGFTVLKPSYCFPTSRFFDFSLS